jgi:cation transport ATPase
MGVELTNASSFESLTGKGVIGEVDGHKVSLGNQALIDELGLNASELLPKAEAMMNFSSVSVIANSLRLRRGLYLELGK